jgi:hypothetical protein
LSLPTLKKEFGDIVMEKKEPTDPEAPPPNNGNGRMNGNGDARAQAEHLAEAIYRRLHGE